MRLALRRQQGRGNAHWPRDRKVMLHVGCGPRGSGVLPPEFQTADWFEVRLDIAPEVDPDIVANIADMPEVGTATVDGIWSSHNLEHVFSHEVPLVLGEFRRVLRPGGLAHIQVPDITVPAKAIAHGRLEAVLYSSPAGPVTAIDMLYGFRPAIERGEHFMAHRTAFTKSTMSSKLTDAGFTEVRVVSRDYALWATAKRSH
jgi:ubiquinone/menaquinone biosynthesis C-methylase UbiE